VTALLDFAERHMWLTGIVSIGLLVIGACTIAAIENVVLGRLRLRAFTIERQACPVCKKRGDCDAGLHS